MSRYLNFYFSPFENPGGSWRNFQGMYLHENDAVIVPMLKRPFMGGGIDCDENGNDPPEFQNAILACVFETHTTPPTLVRDNAGIRTCARFNHPRFPVFFIDTNGHIIRSKDCEPVMFGDEWNPPCTG